MPVILSVLLIVLLLMTDARAADITNRIISETDLDERIRALCEQYCVGNRREGRLTSMEAWSIDENTVGARAKASLRNHEHVQPSAFGIKLGGGVGFSYTMDITADGILDLTTCMLRIDRIRIDNDKLGLSGLARDQEGKSHHIDNCQHLVRGL